MQPVTHSVVAVSSRQGEGMRVEILETSSLGDRSYVVIQGDTAIVVDPQLAVRMGDIADADWRRLRADRRG